MGRGVSGYTWTHNIEVDWLQQFASALVLWPETSVSNSLVSLNAAGGPLSFAVHTILQN